MGMVLIPIRGRSTGGSPSPPPPHTRGSAALWTRIYIYRCVLVWSFLFAVCLLLFARGMVGYGFV